MTNLAVLMVASSLALADGSSSPGPAADWRLIGTGRPIPTESYADQPYVVQTDDGAWLVVMTSGSGREGDRGQTVVTMRSTDRGVSWDERIALEPPDGPEASYAVLLKAPSGRIFCFYNHNTDDIRRVVAEKSPWSPKGYYERVDTLGHYVFKYSDDHGRSWSTERTPIPQRLFEIDRENPYEGRILFFWNVGRPFVYRGRACVPLHKVGAFGHGFMARSEGVLLCSSDLLTRPDPAEATWETLPDGEVGLRTPPGGGPIAEEQSFSQLSDGSLFVVYRSIDGHPVHSYSRDGGRSWTPPAYLRYANGRPVKHPRAANFAWRCKNGKFLYWFQNHGGRWYEDRNPAWIAAGEEIDSPEGRVIAWGQPEILLYDDDPYVRMSYPDLIEDEDRYFVTETQKHLARVHEIDSKLLELLWEQPSRSELTRAGLAAEWSRASSPGTIELPGWPVHVERDPDAPDGRTRDLRAGLTLDLLIEAGPTSATILLDTRTGDGAGLAVSLTPQRTIRFSMSDGRTEASWESDSGLLESDGSHHVGIIVDGGPKLILFVIDGVLNDGGSTRQFGWGRFSPNFRGIGGQPRLDMSERDSVQSLRIYHRALRVTEIIGNARALLGASLTASRSRSSRPTVISQRH